jgi:hypothetical protein
VVVRDYQEAGLFLRLEDLHPEEVLFHILLLLEIDLKRIQVVEGHQVRHTLHEKVVGVISVVLDVVRRRHNQDLLPRIHQIQAHLDRNLRVLAIGSLVRRADLWEEAFVVGGMPCR